MVYKILIRTIEAAAGGGDVLVEYEARNLQNFSYDISIPTSSMALPARRLVTEYLFPSMVFTETEWAFEIT
mgnify:CR=1 FL=1